MEKLLMNETCKTCGLYRSCNSYKLRGIGNPYAPKVVFIASHPEEIDDSKNELYSGIKGEILKSAINGLVPGLNTTASHDRMEDCYITSLVKCTPYSDPILREGIRSPSQLEIDNCKKFLYKELRAFENIVIMTLGNAALTALVGEHKGITHEAGVEREIVINDKTYRLIPNFDPGAVNRQEKLTGEFHSIIDQAFKEKSAEQSINYRVLNYEDALFEMDRAIDLYKSGKISYILYDSETSKSMTPWGGGEIIMISIAHDEEPVGMSIPLVINNDVRFTDLTFPVDIIPWNIDANQRAKLKNKIYEMLNTIPIVGHNLKFDLKWVAWHDFADLSKVKVKDDTEIMAFQIYNRPPGHSNALKDLCRKIFNVGDNWEYEIQEYLKKLRFLEERHFGNIPTGILARYAALDAYYNKRLYEYLKRILPKESYEITNILTKAVHIFSELEIKGLKVDTDMLQYLDISLNQKQKELHNQIFSLPTIKKIITDKSIPALEENAKKKKPKPENEIIEGCFSITSIPDLKNLLFEKDYFNLKPNKRFMTDKGEPQTTRDALDYYLDNVVSDSELERIQREFKEKISLDTKLSPEKIEKLQQKMFTWIDQLREAQVFMNKLKSYKRFGKLISTYINSVPLLSFEGSYKPDYFLNGTVSGRACFTGDTKISLLDGTEKSLSDFNLGEKLYTYGCNLDGSVVAVEAISLGISKYVTELVEVTLDNNEVIKCTPDHRFMLRDGSYKEAKDLTTEDSLMPLYRRVNEAGYEELKNNSTNAWEVTHRVVGFSLKEKEYFDCKDRLLIEEPKESIYVVHHINRIRKNNHPDNLKWMGFWEHLRHHYNLNREFWQSAEGRLRRSQLLKLRWANKDTRPELIEMIRRNSRDRWDNDQDYYNKMVLVGKNSKTNFKNNPEHQRKAMEASKEPRLKAIKELFNDPVRAKLFSESKLRQWEIARNTPGKLESISKNLSNSVSNYFKSETEESRNNRIARVKKSQENPEYYVKQRLGRIYSNIKIIEANLSRSINYQDYIDNILKFKREKLISKQSVNPSSEEEFINSKTYNHKVRSVKKIILDNPVPVYDLSVPRTSNFALSAGVFVHNSSGFHILTNKSDIKRLYTSRWLEDGGLFLCCDQSQVEIRIISSLSNEPKLIKAYSEGYDIHRYTASKIYNKSFDDVTDEERSVGKTIVFAVAYGKGASNLAQEMNMTTEKAQSILDGFFKVYDTLTAWMDEQKKNIKKTGIVTTMWGRKIPVRSAFSNEEYLIAEAERHSVNYPVQSASSDVVLKSFVNMTERAKREKMRSLLVGAVHDSIEADVYPGEIFQMVKMFKEECTTKMNAAYPWITCPLDISFELGTSWGGCVEAKIIESLDDKLVMKCSGLRKDFKRLQQSASNAYNINIEVLKRIPIDQSKVAEEILFRDGEDWEAMVTFLKK